MRASDDLDDVSAGDGSGVLASFLPVALVTVFKSAMAGTCRGHEELAATAIPLEASLPVVPAQGEEDLVWRQRIDKGREVTEGLSRSPNPG